MSRRSAAIALLMVVALTGCGGSPEEPHEPSRAQSLWSSRTPYIGDNSRVAALVREVSPAPEGSFSIGLQTAKPPYALTIEMERLDKPFDRLQRTGDAPARVGRQPRQSVSYLERTRLLLDGIRRLQGPRVRREGTGPGPEQAHGIPGREP